MNVVLWVIAGLLALAFLASGGIKVIQSKEKLAGMGMGWASDFPAGGVKAIGALEVLGAIGLILPALLGIATVLVPFAALGLGLTMIGAIVVHLRRGENSAIGAPIVLLLLSAFVLWGRFGPYAF